MKPEIKKKKNVTTTQDDALLSRGDDVVEPVGVADEPEVEEASIDEEPEVETVDAKKEGPLPVAAQVDARVDVSHIANKDLVVVTMHETIDPPPTVGTYNVQHRLGIKKMEARRNYRLPKYVAEVLVDARKAEYLQID